MGESGKARAFVLGFIAAAGLGLAGLIGVGCAIDANSCPFRDQPKQTSTDGGTLFLANCAVCHGRMGEGGTGPSLTAGVIAGYDAATLSAKIGRGKPLAGMPAFKRSLTQEQIDALAAFVVSLRGGSPGATP